MTNPTGAENAQVQDDAEMKTREWAKRGCPVTCGHCNHAIYPIGLREDVEAALREAEQRGMMRAAEIAYRASLPFDGEVVAGNIRAAIENAAETPASPTR